MSEQLAVGSVFGGYEVREELGRGGMGCVYRARHLTLDRDVALKVLAEQFSRDESYRQRFLKEARAAASLNHPNIAQIYDFGKVGEVYYLAMELVRGRSVGYYLRQVGRFSESDGVAIARHACQALAVAHAAGIVHRDVKPDNLVMTDEGVVKMVDLGLAKRLDDDQNLSQTGIAAGTPHYISPEQIEGRRDIDGRADIYSLGATLFHLVTGRTPFTGPSTLAVIACHLHDRVPDPRTVVPELSEGLSTVVQRMTARDRDQRYADILAVDQDLYQLQTAGALSTALPAVSVPTPPADGRPLDFPTSLATPSGWDRTLLRQVEEQLAAAIGPLAGVLVRREARTSTDLGDLRQRLAEHIQDPAERSAFLAQVAEASDAAGASRVSLSGAASAGAPSATMTSSALGSFEDAAMQSAEQSPRP